MEAEMEMFQRDKSSTFSDNDKSLFYESTETDSLYDSGFRIVNHINAKDAEHPKKDVQYSYKQNVQDLANVGDAVFLSESDQMVPTEHHAILKKTDELFFDSERTEPWWRTSDRDELALLVSKRSFGLVENCDLPRPQRTYAKGEGFGDVYDGIFTPSNDEKYLGGNQTFIKGPMASVYVPLQAVPTNQLSTERRGAILKRNMGENDPGNALLLEALCHSQTRAREAETAAKEAHEEKEHIMKLVFKQASQLFAYKQWFQLLHLENLYYQIKQNEPISKLLPLMLSQPRTGTAQKAKKPKASQKKGKFVKKEGRCLGDYAVAIALGLSLVGAGMLLGWTVGCLLPAF